MRTSGRQTSRPCSRSRPRRDAAVSGASGLFLSLHTTVLPNLKDPFSNLKKSRLCVMLLYLHIINSACALARALQEVFICDASPKKTGVFHPLVLPAGIQRYFYPFAASCVSPAAPSGRCCHPGQRLSRLLSRPPVWPHPKSLVLPVRRRTARGNRPPLPVWLGHDLQTGRLFVYPRPG